MTQSVIFPLLFSTNPGGGSLENVFPFLLVGLGFLAVVTALRMLAWVLRWTIVGVLVAVLLGALYQSGNLEFADRWLEKQGYATRR